MMEKIQRNERILLDIAEDYIKTAKAVSSGELLKQHKYKLSSATLRNIMAELDEAGFLYQPHTSAGRIPTQKAYQFLVDKITLRPRKMFNKSSFGESRSKSKKANKRIRPKFKKELREAIRISPDTAAYMLSHHLAETTNAMAFVGLLSVNHFYREGLHYLLQEPEFLTAKNVHCLIEYVDSLETRMDRLYKAIQNDIKIYVGDFENHASPFSLMAFTSELGENERGVFGIIGPMRMRYTQNMRALDEIRDIFV
jgi:transcriptional regulator of heat shock response